MSTGVAFSIEGLRDPGVFRHAVESVEVLETHISWVVLAGEYAYKIKKPVDLGFLDFSTLERRRVACLDELRLNRRLAPELYLRVDAIVAEAGGLRLAQVPADSQAALEYAVAMRRFPQEARLDRVLERGELEREPLRAFARQLAAFHGEIPPAPASSDFGSPRAVWAASAENFAHVGDGLADPESRVSLAELRCWAESWHAEHAEEIARRKSAGFVRECHGDLHLENLVLLDSRVVAFDGIEFSETLRWIDTASELAFPVMDLESRGRSDLARAFLNAYLEASGDFEALRVLDYYKAYRAMVRAKVAAIRSRQGLSDADADELRRRFRALVDASAEPRRRPPGELVLLHGPSGAGKSTFAEAFVEARPAIRLRSDVERKRLHGLAPEARSGSGVGSGLYSDESTRRTYERLATLAADVLAAGYTAVVDAAFLTRWQRGLLRRVARDVGSRCTLVALTAPAAELRRRVDARARRGRDPSEADAKVLGRQHRTLEPIQPGEVDRLERVDTSVPGAVERCLSRCWPS